MASLKEGEWSCYRNGQFKRENGHITEVFQFNRRRMMLERWPVLWRENGHVTEVDSLMEGEWSSYSLASNGGSMVMLQRWSL